MAGTIVKSLDHKSATSGANAIQEQFKILYDFLQLMVAAGHCTRIALQYGSGGTGTDFHDGANPFGENAFAVYTWGSGAGTARDIMIQWASASAFGASPGNPGAVNGGTGDGVGIVMATREDGTSPWAGGTADDGSDTKAATVWTAGGSALHVIDLANTTGGTYATNHENCLRVTNDTPVNMRMHVVGDADNIAVLSSESDDGNYSCLTLGRYSVRPGFSGPNPLYSLSNMTDLMWTEVGYGTGGGTLTREGGILGRSGADEVAQIRILEVLFAQLLNDTYQPNQQIVPAELDGVTPQLGYNNAIRYGYVGKPDGLVLAVFFTDLNHAVDPSASRAYMAVTGGSALRWGIPWDGGAAPGVGVTRAGRQS
jgi:hypothetical protein